MNSTFKIISLALRTLADSIDAGNTNATEEELLGICDMISLVTNPNSKRSKYQSANHLKISRATFDNYVKKGLLPVGRDEQGFKEKFWYNRDLWKLRKELNGEE